MDLFEYMQQKNGKQESPLASRIRPTTLDEIVGQAHILGKDKLLYRAIKADKLRSIIFNSGHNALLQQMAEMGIRIYFFYTPFAGINIVMSMYFAATEKVLPAQTITLLRGLVLVVPLLLLLARLLDLTGVWLVYPVTEVCTAIVGAILFFLSKKKQT